MATVYKCRHQFWFKIKNVSVPLILSFFRQVAVADLTIINKTDLVNEEELAQMRAAVRSALHSFTAVLFPFYYSVAFLLVDQTTL